MRIRNVLGAAATATALTLGMGLVASAANAAPLSSNDWDYDDDWGYYYSNNGKAKAKGWIDVDYDHEESNTVRIGGKLYDRDYRTEHQGGKCGYVAFRYVSWDDEEDDWSSSYKTYKQCGTDGWKNIKFTRHDVAQVEVKVCQIGLYSSYPTKCGSWHEIYNAWDDEFGYTV